MVLVFDVLKSTSYTSVIVNSSGSPLPDLDLFVARSSCIERDVVKTRKKSENKVFNLNRVSQLLRMTKKILLVFNLHVAYV